MLLITLVQLWTSYHGNYFSSNQVGHLLFAFDSHILIFNPLFSIHFALYPRISLVLFKSAGLQPKLGAVTADLNNSERLLTQLTALVDCKALHYNYLNATRGLCENGLLGLLLMLVASFTAAILLTIMVWVDSHTWIYIRKRSDYSQVDEPSYASQHQHPGPQQMHMPNHTRTLPRNMHNG